jgi:hypothetical protein
MIPILIEPTCLCFDLANNNQELDKANELIKFKSFIIQLQTLFSELDNNKMKIAITKELLEIYANSIPISVYKTDNPLYRLVIETYTHKLGSALQIIHKFGDHNLEIAFEDEYVDKSNQIYESDTYLHWLDMCGLVFLKKVPTSVLKSDIATIFKGKSAYINDKNGNREELFIFDELNKVASSRDIKLYRLSRFIRSLAPPCNIQCSGTGTHSSMWGKSIRNVNDIPSFERELIKKLISTGMVKSIKFLTFNKKYGSVETPIIIVNSIEEMDTSLLLYCTLRGQGIKQHGQDILLETIKEGTMDLLFVFDNIISIDNIEYLYGY